MKGLSTQWSVMDGPLWFSAWERYTFQGQANPEVLFKVETEIDMDVFDKGFENLVRF